MTNILKAGAVANSALMRPPTDVISTSPELTGLQVISLKVGLDLDLQEYKLQTVVNCFQ